MGTETWYDPKGLTAIQEPGTYLLAGDPNGDGSIDISDAVFILSYLFRSSLAPKPIVPSQVEE